MHYTQFKAYYPYIGPFDPCPPIREKFYNTPPQLYMVYQPPGLPQYSPYEALKCGTLWPALFGPYDAKAVEGRVGT
ncbi:spore coat associated protein CotJA [Paenibacillus sedimenti]|uniref:Spore coat associated protein CotJA n=1 Tax=Paenibacillus sedimenti TaxID=2770274 RepID=A0A926KV78_9BACL|nr:spore coat associated protein CotJA [Paenibacillus sedimenti]MBD0382739.1 spore coat associated protein CotJA [Paenibacillus sedimenti]